MEEKYRLLLSGGLQDDFWKELKEKAGECGVSVSLSSSSEILMEGENKPLSTLIIWLLDLSRLDKVRYLKSDP
jgi:hypothetical protein